MIVSQSHAGQIYNVSKIAFGKDIKIVPAAGAGNSVNIIILILLFNICYYKNSIHKKEKIKFFY